ncbi:MAG: flavin reductase family protein [Thermoguttaceae bacterium]|jgi:flavin reductase (DIM6/NTAB) family NADH-FMN oxidoreductase RutF|nr:flavin reductase family protein [Thermoguttaceae bacterium]
MSRTNFGPKTWMFPMPALVIGTYNADGSVNAMTAAWGGICQDKPPGIIIALSNSHKTTANIERTGFFTVAIATVETVVPTDFFGIVSGIRDPKKFEKTGLHAHNSEFVNAPVIEEYKMVLECKLFDKFVFKDEVRFVGEIVNVTVDDSVLTDGQIDAAKLQPVAWNPISHEYVKLGESVGLAWNIGKALMKD